MPLPLELRTALQIARDAEGAGENVGRRHRSVQATGALLLVAQEHGWPVSEMGRALGIRESAARARVAVAKRRLGDARPAIAMPWRVGRLSLLTRLRRRPVEERDWLFLGEVAALLEVPVRTVSQWRIDGLWPRVSGDSARLHPVRPRRSGTHPQWSTLGGVVESAQDARTDRARFVICCVAGPAAPPT